MFRGKDSWLTAVAVLAIPTLLALIPAWVHAFGPPDQMNREDTEAIGHAVDVSIALCAAYLALDRTRLHKKADEVVATVASIFSRDEVLKRFEGSGHALDQELVFLIVLAYAGDPVAQRLATRHEAKIRKSPYYKTILIWLLKRFLVVRLDRKITFLLLVSLCLWEVGAACMNVKPWPWQLVHEAIWSVLVLVSLGFLVPAVGWLSSDWAMARLAPCLKDWADDIAALRNAPVATLMVPVLATVATAAPPPAPPPSPAKKSRTATKSAASK